ncbi:MAG: hypothetical protein KDD37_07590 [Bdellovibrionales bacterium]|nr:hypothetical protein [Bdellovibrionales bacterium]
MKFFSVLLILTFVMVSYQNCSVYESEGRSVLNSEGVTIYQQKVIDPSCDIYFNDLFLQDVFGTEPYQTLFDINSKQEVVCRIKTLERDYECKYSMEYADWFRNLPDYLEILPDSIRLSMQYEQLGLKYPKANKLLFVVKRELSEAVGCSTDYREQSLSQDLSRLATLAQSMLEQSVQTRP